MLILPSVTPLTYQKYLSLSKGQMTDLIYTEKELVQSLREYISAEESKLAAVKRYIQTLWLNNNPTVIFRYCTWVQYWCHWTWMLPFNATLYLLFKPEAELIPHNYQTVFKCNIWKYTFILLLLTFLILWFDKYPSLWINVSKK